MLKQNSIEQVLEVLNLVRVRHNDGDSIIKAYQSSVAIVSKNYNVRYQTIGDFRRRLGLRNVNEFYSFLEKWLIEGNYKPIMEVLKRNASPESYKKISSFFGETSELSSDEDIRKIRVSEESFTFRLRSDIAKKLKVMSVMAGDSEPVWLNKTVSQAVEEQYKNWIAKQKVE
jgi:hypothetical protein